MALTSARLLTRTVHEKWICAHSLTLRPLVCINKAAFYGEYRRPGQAQDRTPPWKKIRFSFAKGVQGIRKHFGLLKDEAMERWVGPQGRPLIEHMLEQTRVQWEFRGPESLEQWLVSTDREIGGRSEAYLKLGRNDSACMLYGTLCSTPPRDGETCYSGYCTLRSRQLLSSFDRKKNIDWSSFNTLYIRLRGDGRPWMINIAAETYFSHQKDDLYNYFLYTRGGPYWQDVKVSTIGFTLGDKADGPFQLEIDFIAVCNDRAHTEEFAYEMYKRNPEV
ncbi:complex I intermediate-associated protein 30, mitochondrial-like [Scleropages formosus]|uniref:Complex I intermediate-associated protein 30, mitochondrial n=1 Tax=Scleropages formosus TaxID=113540 RepID=A0A0P7Z1V4_SCLFO|nr:complex I intermediate-associated protein 30, mitochondrial-like [Scleropages formosus]